MTISNATLKAARTLWPQTEGKNWQQHAIQRAIDEETKELRSKLKCAAIALEAVRDETSRRHLPLTASLNDLAINALTSIGRIEL